MKSAAPVTQIARSLILFPRSASPDPCSIFRPRRLFSLRIDEVAIAPLPCMRALDHRYCKIDAKTIPKRPNSAPCVGLLQNPGSCGRNAPNPAVDGQDPDFRSAALPGAA